MQWYFDWRQIVCLLSGRCYCQFGMILLWQMVSHLGRYHTSLLMLADIVALWQIEQPLLSYAMADVINIVTVDRWYINTLWQVSLLV